LTPVQREFVTGNEIPRIGAHRCIVEASIDVSDIEASIGSQIVQIIKAPPSSEPALTLLPVPSAHNNARQVALSFGFNLHVLGPDGQPLAADNWDAALAAAATSRATTTTEASDVANGGPQTGSGGMVGADPENMASARQGDLGGAEIHVALELPAGAAAANRALRVAESAGADDYVGLVEGGEDVHGLTAAAAHQGPQALSRAALLMQMAATAPSGRRRLQVVGCMCLRPGPRLLMLVRVRCQSQKF
jgi:hypothetical protein